MSAPAGLFVVGASHHTAPVALREQLALGAESEAALAAELAAQPGLRELAVLNTCNRIEFYGVASDPAAAARIQAAFCARQGVDTAEFGKFGLELGGRAALQHLLEVAAGLDSQMLGETEIFGQVKDAYAAAQSRRSVGPVLNRVFQKTFQAAKHVRSATAITVGQVSVANVAVELALNIFGSLGAARILLLGAGEIGGKTARAFQSRGAAALTVSSRSLERAMGLATDLGASALPFDQREHWLAEFDIVVGATSAPGTVVSLEAATTAMRKRPSRPLFFIDLAMPRDVETAVAQIDNVFLYNLDDLAKIAADNRALRDAEVTRCRALLSERGDALWKQIEPQLGSFPGGAEPRAGCRPGGRTAAACVLIPAQDIMAGTRTTPPPLPVAVLGAGITGLTAAWHLHQTGIPTVLFEASDKYGGAIETVRDGGWLWETGPNSLLEGDAETSGLIEAMGLGSRRLYAGKAAAHRYVLKRGKLEAAPASPGQFLRSRLFSWRAKLGLLGEVLRPRGRLDRDESVAEFTLRRLGREFLDYAVDPFVSGVYAGDPARLSVRHAFPKLFALEREHGSLIRGALGRRKAGGGPRGRILSFPEGLGELPRALAAPLGGSLRLDTRVLTLRHDADGWEIAFERAGETRRERFSAVICALPAGPLARLRLEGCDRPEALSALGEIEHPPVASIFTGFLREDVKHPLDGFGVLVPRVEGRRILGTLFSSTLFPGRAPDGRVALTTFVGGSREPALGQFDDDALIELVRTELAGLLGVRAAPVHVSVRRHAQAIPQYIMGYDRYLGACARAEASAPGLYIGGNFRDGISLPSCLASGRRLALGAAAFHQHQG